jgi:HEAT repeat protein
LGSVIGRRFYRGIAAMAMAPHGVVDGARVPKGYHRPMQRLLVWMLALGALACAGGPRGRVMSAVDAGDLDRALDEYEDFREDEGGGDGELLAQVAGLALERAVTGDDARERDAALSQLTMAGTAGLPIVERLASGERPLAIRAKALVVLARRGDSDAIAALRGFLDEDDSEVLAAAVVALDGEGDEAALIALLENTSGGVRREAAAKLEQAAPSGNALVALAEAARVDPELPVRAAATRSLAAFGAPAFDHVRERLSDPDAMVRTAAVRSLVEIDRSRALSALGLLLEVEPSQAGIEAARILAAPTEDEETVNAEGVVLARAFLRRALTTGDMTMRSQAAVALTSLPTDESLDADLLRAMRDDEDPRVRLAVASTLRRREETKAQADAALRALVQAGGMTGVQAAAILAAEEDANAIGFLRRSLRHDDAAIRRVAARALARDALRPDEARSALRDDDAMVRINAAGGILAASVAG